MLEIAIKRTAGPARGSVSAAPPESVEAEQHQAGAYDHNSNRSGRYDIGPAADYRQSLIYQGSPLAGSMARDNKDQAFSVG